MSVENSSSSLRSAWLGLVAVETLCQIAVKLSGEYTGPLTLTAGSILLLTGSFWFWVALTCYLAGFVLWMTILSRSALSLAFPASAAVFLGALLASVVLFHETFSIGNALGSAAIVAGIFLLGGEPANRSVTESSTATSQRRPARLP